MERDLAALEDKVSTLDGEAARLAGIHADHAPAIHSKRDEIAQAWQRLVQKAQVRCSIIIYNCINMKYITRFLLLVIILIYNCIFFIIF